LELDGLVILGLFVWTLELTCDRVFVNVFDFKFYVLVEAL